MPQPIFDIGMHLGEDTDYYLKLGFPVIAIEANPKLVRHCRDRFPEAIASHRLQIVEGAIADRGDTITFYENGQTVWGTTDPDWVKRNEKLGFPSRPITVPVINIREIFKTYTAQYGAPYFVKIDVEGADGLVLQAIRELPQKPPYISVEAEKVSFRDFIKQVRLLQAAGYRRFSLVAQDTIPGTSADQDGLSHTFEPHCSGRFGADLGSRYLPSSFIYLKYLWLHSTYRLFGDDPLLWKIKGGKTLYYFIIKRVRSTFPGWHDLHAKHKNAP